MLKNAVGEPSSLSIISGIEEVWVRVCGGGGLVSIISVENFLSHSTETFCRGSPLCCVSENFRYRKILDKRGEEYQDFPSKIYCLTVPKKSYGKSLQCH